MNPNEDQMLAQLERELRSLQPLPPDPELLLRLDRMMHDPVLDRAPAQQTIVPFKPAAPTAAPIPQNQPLWKPWAAVAACAAVATGAVTWKQNQLNQLSQANQPLAFKPAKSPGNFVAQGVESQVQGIRPGAIIMDPQNGPMRELRVQFNNQQQFVDPSNNAVMRIGYPSEQRIYIRETVQ